MEVAFENVYPHSRGKPFRKTSFPLLEQIRKTGRLLLISAEYVGTKYAACGEQTLWPVAGCWPKGVGWGVRQE